MEDMIFLGRDGQLQTVPQTMWKQHLSQIPEHGPTRLSFMTEAHHVVRNFVVKELALRQQPIEVKLISEMLNLPLDQVKNILDELEQKLFFLVRNEQGGVTWAYPVTIETTPHRLNFDTGEQLYAA
jgi:predicted transcriptional regulator